MYPNDADDVTIVTGGAGFIGSEVVRQLLARPSGIIVTVDNLSYAGNVATMGSFLNHPRHIFENADICDSSAMGRIFSVYQPRSLIHLAAESHVDRSIDDPSSFVTTNVVGTVTLLEAARHQLRPDLHALFRFVHVSTDEVFGSLGAEGAFNESTRYDPSSPYSASKAASDHMARAWHRTFGIPTIVTNCSNNYGPYQFPEKFVPLIISKCLKEEMIPIYGSGTNIRDWLYVGDHAAALLQVLERGRVGSTYNIGGNAELKNIEVAHIICEMLDIERPRSNGVSYKELIKFVVDRPGHDHRYAIDARKIRGELNWEPRFTLEEGMSETVRWYLANQEWVSKVTERSYDGHRLGRAERAQ